MAYLRAGSGLSEGCIIITRAQVKSWTDVETTAALQAQSHGKVMETQCLQACSVFVGLRANTPGEDFVGHLKKAAAAFGARLGTARVIDGLVQRSRQVQCTHASAG